MLLLFIRTINYMRLYFVNELTKSLQKAISCICVVYYSLNKVLAFVLKNIAAKLNVSNIGAIYLYMYNEKSFLTTFREVSFYVHFGMLQEFIILRAAVLVIIHFKSI